MAISNPQTQPQPWAKHSALWRGVGEPTFSLFSLVTLVRQLIKVRSDLYFLTGTKRLIELWGGYSEIACEMLASPVTVTAKVC